MERLDYQKIGLKIGIEVHQRLRTHKIFCSCVSAEGSPGASIKRRLRPVAGELGAVDPAALYEGLRGREFEYTTYSQSTCLVELDEEPPHAVDADALYASLQVAKMLGCDVPNELHVMRKTVVDGSNTTGFQRTAVVGLDGTLVTSFGDVKITSVALEEESSQILERAGRTVRYGLDRLGIPLIEIGTAPDAHTPEQARELAEALGSLLRSTGRVQRGIGTIRQDVNVSIHGGARVEIKGFQELRSFEALVHNEAQRQFSLLALAEELRTRNASATEPREVTHLFTDTQNKILARSIADRKRVYAFVLKGFDGLLKRHISGERTFGRELAEHAVAQGTGGMIHSDEQIGSYDLTQEFSKLREVLNADEKDAICIIAEDEDVARRASAAVIARAAYALKGVPEETRAPNPDATTSYLRPLPGGARMYPETDVMPMIIDAKTLASVKRPRSLEERRRGLVSLGVPPQTAAELADSTALEIFEGAARSPIDAKRAAELLTSTMTALRREGANVDSIKTEDLVSLIRDLHSIPKEAVADVLKRLSEGSAYSDAVTVERIDKKELDRIVERVVRDNMGIVNKEGEAAFKKMMGPLMAQVRGKVAGELAADALRKRLKSVLK
ncbi:MAG: Glu-tRNA(Gln) amidotransferase subunit GatE [Candidatus Aenigmarchaeota archaeon]|nr:Glu-tRNA(Gln) amidotransferase subunit GatE [Candidatus Aenigmarchaeota archaeon]